MSSRWKSLFGRNGQPAADEPPAADPPPRKRRDAYGAIRVPAFRWFVLGSMLSNIGNLMRTATVAWEIWERTHSASRLAMIGLVLAGPVLLLALPAGVAADRFSRRAILLVANLGLAVCGLGLAWASWTRAPLWCVYALLLGTGVCRALGWPATVAIFTQLVPAEQYANASTWRSAAYQTSAVTGPLIGGFILATWNPATAYLLDVATTVAFLAVIIVINLSVQKRSAGGVSSWDSLLEGVRFVRREPIILSTITLDMVAVMFGGATALLPIYAEDILRVGATGYGWLRAMFAIGAIVMSLLLTSRVSIRRAGPALLLSVVAFGIWTIVFGFSEIYAVSLLALFMLGAVDAVSVVIRATLLQLLTPDELRGRVGAVNAIFINTSNEIGEFESGVTAHWFGPVLAVCGGGVLTLVTVAAIARTWPSLWHLGRLEDVRPRELEPAQETAAPIPDPLTQEQAALPG